MENYIKEYSIAFIMESKTSNEIKVFQINLEVFTRELFFKVTRKVERILYGQMVSWGYSWDFMIFTTIYRGKYQCLYIFKGSEAF